METGNSRTWNGEIPIELMEDILLRLPMVDLLRFRCVSKKWRDIIDGPNFVKSHLNLPNKPRSVLVIHEKQCIYYLHLDSVSKANSRAKLKKLREPCYQIYGNNDGVVGHINGLVCCLCDRELDRDSGVTVWNPWTMKHIEVPPPKERSRMRSGKWSTFWSWGFGYDRDSDDYIVITLACVVTVYGPSDRTLVWIYSLRSGSWRMLDECLYTVPGFQQDIVFLDGAFYWIANSPSDQRLSSSICALHLGKLEYSLVPSPNLSGSTYLGRLAVLDGCLSATSCDRGILGVDLWVMKEYGVKESWTRLMHYPRLIKPLAHIRNGKKLLFVTSNEVMPYRFKTGSFKRVIRRSASFFNSVVCIPSLVFPRSDL